jgi:hypothetical protein
MASDDDILTVEDGWLLHLEECFGDEMTIGEKGKIAGRYARLGLEPPGFERKCELLARLRKCDGDIIHQWDDPKDFSMWRNALKALKP